MNIVYRTRTYIAADWDGDSDAVQQLHKWNNSNYFNLSFTDAHDLKQARDSSLNCSIKRSLAERLDASKTFVLIVGSNTNSVRSGSCQYCSSKNSWNGSCARGYFVDNRSYIEYECEKAVHDRLNIVVLYNAATVDRSKCPDTVKYIGIHKAMCYYQSGQYYWDYQAVKSALGQ
ncbi:MAG: TIR domain-containing protein [Dysgonamonadaceae bacterium]